MARLGNVDWNARRWDADRYATDDDGSDADWSDGTVADDLDWEPGEYTFEVRAVGKLDPCRGW